MTERERKYSIFSRELLAAFEAVRYFKYFIIGSGFYLLSDNKAQVQAFLKPTERDNPRETRQLLYLSQFTTDMRHISGADTLIADSLSRSLPKDTKDTNDKLQTNISAIFEGADKEELRLAQREDKELEDIIGKKIVYNTRKYRWNILP